jgi:hypothetical protein
MLSTLAVGRAPARSGERLMLSVERPADLIAFAGKKLGTSDWVLID